MIQNYIENANFEDTGFHYALSLISGKHKMVILYCLMEYRVVRFNELKRYLKNISDKTLAYAAPTVQPDRRRWCIVTAGMVHGDRRCGAPGRHAENYSGMPLRLRMDSPSIWMV